MKEKPNYYAIIPATVRYDTRLKANEKLLYGEITALTEKTGECWASNSYFANLYSVSPSAISKWIKNLSDCNYIKTDYIYKNNSKEIEKRVIKMVLPNINRGIDKSTRGVLINGVGGYCQKDKDNTTSINTTSINIKEIYKEKKTQFKKPTLNELKEYVKNNNLKIDEEYFMDHYNANGWLVGKSKMKDWKATARNWNRRNKKQTEKGRYESATTQAIKAVMSGEYVMDEEILPRFDMEEYINE